MADLILSCNCAEGISNRNARLNELSGGLPEDFDYSAVRSVADVQAFILVLPNCDRGRAAVGLYRHHDRIGTTAAYSGIMIAWDHDHRQVTDAFGSPEKFVAALNKVAPRLDSALPEQIEIWRGTVTSKDDTLRNCIGLSWSRTREIACWFALHDYASELQPSLIPIVLRAKIDRSLVVAMHGARGEREVIVDVSSLMRVAGNVATCDGLNTSPSEFECRLGDLYGDKGAFDRLIASWRLASKRYERWKRKLESRRTQGAKVLPTLFDL